MGHQYIFILIALFLFVNFSMMVNRASENQLMDVIGNQGYYLATSIAQSVIEKSWMIPFADLNTNLDGKTQTIVRGSIPFTVHTSIIPYTCPHTGNVFKELKVKVTSAKYKVEVNSNYIYSNLK